MFQNQFDQMEAGLFLVQYGLALAHDHLRPARKQNSYQFNLDFPAGRRRNADYLNGIIMNNQRQMMEEGD